MAYPDWELKTFNWSYHTFLPNVNTRVTPTTASSFDAGLFIKFKKLEQAAHKCKHQWIDQKSKNLKNLGSGRFATPLLLWLNADTVV